MLPGYLASSSLYRSSYVYAGLSESLTSSVPQAGDSANLTLGSVDSRSHWASATPGSMPSVTTAAICAGPDCSGWNQQPQGCGSPCIVGCGEQADWCIYGGGTNCESRYQACVATCDCTSLGFGWQCCASNHTCTLCARGTLGLNCKCNCPSGQVNCGNSGTCCAESSCCNNKCTELSFDRNNCGKCGEVCPTHASCYQGKCYCPTGLPDICNGVCVNLTSSSSNCGTCGYSCPGPTTGPSTGYAICSNGSCGIACDTGFTLCNNTDCYNLSSNVNNCGACGYACPGPATGPSTGYATCSNSTCGIACYPGFTKCGTSLCVPVCPDRYHLDPTTCMCVCNNPCNSGTTCCPDGTVCSSDNVHCCPPGQLYCNGNCVSADCSNSDTSWDQTKCSCICNVTGLPPCNGTCCSQNKTCTNGQCICSQQCPPYQGQNPDTCTCSSSCGYGLTDCNGQCVNTSSDSNNCGQCNNKCNGNLICQGGNCVCPVGASGQQLTQCPQGIEYCCDPALGQTCCLGSADQCPNGGYCSRGTFCGTAPGTCIDVHGNLTDVQC